MTTASGIPALIDKLVAVGQAAFGASSPVDVRDGPVTTYEDTGQQLWIGAQDPETGSTAAESEQTWGPMSPQHKRDEEVRIHCLALAWAGDDDYKTVRDQVFAQMQAFTDAIAADPSLAGVVLYARSPGSNVSFVQGPNQLGAVEARVGFDVTARIRLT